MGFDLPAHRGQLAVAFKTMPDVAETQTNLVCVHSLAGPIQHACYNIDLNRNAVRDSSARYDRGTESPEIGKPRLA